MSLSRLEQWDFRKCAAEGGLEDYRTFLWTQLQSLVLQTVAQDSAPPFCSWQILGLLNFGMWRDECRA